MNPHIKEDPPDGTSTGDPKEDLRDDCGWPFEDPAGIAAQTTMVEYPPDPAPRPKTKFLLYYGGLGCVAVAPLFAQFEWALSTSVALLGAGLMLGSTREDL